MSARTLAPDVLVIGGGLAGAVAALAARAGGASVALVRRAPGATALCGGAVGVAPDLGALPGDPLIGRRSPLESARRLALRRPSHPYARLGVEALEEALAFAGAELSAVLEPPDGRPRFLVHVSGAVSECALCLRSQAPGDLRRARWLAAVVGFSGHLGFDPRLAALGAARLTAAGGPSIVTVEAPAFLGPDEGALRPIDLARALEGSGAAEGLGAAVRQVLPRGATVAILPPVLGLDPAARVLERVAAAAGLPVAEAVSDPPSLPGLRLDAALLARLRAADVVLVEGEALAGPGLAPGAPLQVGEVAITARAWVLATGRFVGGGLVRGRTLEEPLLGLPVLASEVGAAGVALAGRPAEALTVRARQAAQPLLAAGVAIDAEGRPLDEAGRAVHPALYAAGAVIGGHEHAADGTGLGVAILSGFLAGRRAAAAAARRSTPG
jgi:glycerol-3-phosphate dehydrogenase subunit B